MTADIDVKALDDIKAEMRAAFDGDDVARKNRALRWATDALESLSADRDRLEGVNEELGRQMNECARLKAEAEHLLYGKGNDKCWKCGRIVRVRKDGNLSHHRPLGRFFDPYDVPPARCSAGGTKAY